MYWVLQFNTWFEIHNDSQKKYELVMNLREGNQVFFPLHPSSKFGLKKHCFLLTYKFGVFDARHAASETSLNCQDKL